LVDEYFANIQVGHQIGGVKLQDFKVTGDAVIVLSCQ
jgi:hypothetical protein